jgi:hypothetical protein
MRKLMTMFVLGLALGCDVEQGCPDYADHEIDYIEHEIDIVAPETNEIVAKIKGCRWIGDVCACGDLVVGPTYCDPNYCDGDIEMDKVPGVNAEGLAEGQCICNRTDGGPDEPRDPSLCGCHIVRGGCECDGITYVPEVCT